VALERKKTLNVFKEAKNAWGSYDEYPVGPNGTDPMPYLSRNRVAQPFFVVSAEDQVLIQMAGEGRIEFREIEPAALSLSPGDTVYVPAGVPSRVVPSGENLQIRLKAEPPAREAVAWYCAGCGELVHAIDVSDGVLQEQYWSAVNAFNADPAVRACAACGAVHAPVDLGDIAWPAVAAALRAEGA
jgi:mannose-6-phosphate isomerase-like protein (cupin superfamily)